MVQSTSRCNRSAICSSTRRSASLPPSSVSAWRNRLRTVCSCSRRCLGGIDVTARCEGHQQRLPQPGAGSGAVRKRPELVEHEALRRLDVVEQQRLQSHIGEAQHIGGGSPVSPDFLHAGYVPVSRAESLYAARWFGDRGAGTDRAELRGDHIELCRCPWVALAQPHHHFADAQSADQNALRSCRSRAVRSRISWRRCPTLGPTGRRRVHQSGRSAACSKDRRASTAAPRRGFPGPVHRVPWRRSAASISSCLAYASSTVAITKSNQFKICDVERRIATTPSVGSRRSRPIHVVSQSAQWEYSTCRPTR